MQKVKCRMQNHCCPANGRGIFGNLQNNQHLRREMRVHDLNSRAHSSLGRAVCFLPRRSCVRWTIRVDATAGLFATPRIQRLRRTIRRQPPPTRLLVSRSVLMLGLRAAHVSRESAGCRDLPASPGAQAVPRWLSRQDFAQHAGGCESRSRLAKLRRFCAGADSSSPTVVRPRAARRGSGADGLRARLDDHRPVPELVPVGQVSPLQGRRQAAYPARPARQHSVFCACFPGGKPPM